MFDENLFNLPLFQVSDLGEPLAFRLVSLQLRHVGFSGPVGVPQDFVYNRNSSVQVASAVGVQVLPRLLVHILASRKHVSAHFLPTFDIIMPDVNIRLSYRM